MKIPKINWIPFDKNDPPADLGYHGEEYLIFLREDNYDNGATWRYHVDRATAYGSYLDDFWDTENDWDEGQRIEVLAYAEFPCYLKETDLVERNAMFQSISVCIMHRDGSWERLFEHIPTFEEADLIAQYAMCMRTNYEDLIFIFPGYNRSINDNPGLWTKACELAQQYVSEE